MEQNTEALLREIATKLGTTTEKLYGVLVKQSFIKGIQEIIFMGFWCIALCVLHYVLGLTYFTYLKDPLANEPISNIAYYIAWGLNIGIWVLSIFVIPGSLGDIVGYFKNPEYDAVQTILAMLPSKD